MDEEFWQIRWRENRIAFHENRPNSLLVSHFHRLGLAKGDTVFVPLSGKAVDLDWLSAQKLRVVGVEFNRQAVEEVFARRNIVPDVRTVGRMRRYRAEAFEMFVGDFFDLTADMLGAVDAVYDRAALVALPPDTRANYARHLADITNKARQLLISFDYDQSQTLGPPFSVPGQDISRLYDGLYSAELLASREISGPLAERCQGSENVWLLDPV